MRHHFDDGSRNKAHYNRRPDIRRTDRNKYSREVPRYYINPSVKKSPPFSPRYEQPYDSRRYDAIPDVAHMRDHLPIAGRENVLPLGRSAVRLPEEAEWTIFDLKEEIRALRIALENNEIDANSRIWLVEDENRSLKEKLLKEKENGVRKRCQAIELESEVNRLGDEMKKLKKEQERLSKMESSLLEEIGRGAKYFNLCTLQAIAQGIYVKSNERKRMILKNNKRSLKNSNLCSKNSSAQLESWTSYIPTRFSPLDGAPPRWGTQASKIQNLKCPLLKRKRWGSFVMGQASKKIGAVYKLELIRFGRKK